MLFGDADIEHAARESFGKGKEARGVGHSRSNSDKFWSRFALFYEGFGECGRKTPGL